MNEFVKSTDRQPSWIGPYGPADFSDIIEKIEPEIEKINAYIKSLKDEIEELKRINVNALNWNETVAASVLNKCYYEDEIKRLREELEAESSRAYHRGHADGEDIGYKNGYDDGYNDGLEVGRAGM